jgi:hypothetical protein
LPARAAAQKNIPESCRARDAIESPERKLRTGGTSCQEEIAVKMQTIAGLALASLLALSAVPAAHADEFDQATRINFDAPVRVPGQILPAGTYWFVLLNHGDNPAVVQIFNADRTALIQTIQTGYTERSEATGDTVLAFAEPDTPANTDADIPALTKWFYPGRSIGNEFIYSRQSEQQIGHEKEVMVPASQPGNSAAGD